MTSCFFFRPARARAAVCATPQPAPPPPTPPTPRPSNPLTALLARYYPAALQVFSDLTSSTSLAFLQRYPTPEAGQALCFSDFESFARSQRHPPPRRLPPRFARLQAPQPTRHAETTLG